MFAKERSTKIDYVDNRSIHVDDSLQHINEPPHGKTKWHVRSLIRVIAVRMKKAWVLSYPVSVSEDSDQTGRMPWLI